MTPLKKAYPGRLIFDHLPKTAGQAINAWLVAELGSGCVTPNLIGDHSDLIRKYGGLYSVISAHVHFDGGKGHDPRYQYMTLFREPVDRVISWLFFVINNHDDDQLPGLRQAAIKFLQKEDCSLNGHIGNAYVEHFCRIEGDGTECDDQKIANALSAIKKYDVVGLYDNMPQFLAEAAALIGLPEPETLDKVNVTTKRPQVNEISTALRDRLVALNQLDIRLFEEVVAWKKSSMVNPIPRKEFIEKHIWRKCESLQDRVIVTPDLVVSPPLFREGNHFSRGQLMTLDMDIFLTREIDDLEMGIHIFDADRRWVFGTNSTLLGQSHRSLSSDVYQVSHHVIADLPAGKYTVGFAFAEKLPQGVKELFWQDVMCEFEVSRPIDKAFAGYAYLPAGISLRHATKALMGGIVTHHAGCLLATKPLQQLTVGEMASIHVEVRNHSDQAWVGDNFRPINFSYHWLDASGEMVWFDGLRTAISAGGIASGTSINADMQVEAPPEAGAYILVLTLVQELVGWFEDKGFEAARLAIAVVEPHA